MGENLNKLYGEVIEYVRSCGLRLFPTNSDLTEEAPNAVIWDLESGDWKSFVEIAKEEGARTLIVEMIKGRDEKHADDIGSLSLAWVKDGVMYIFEKEAEWWVEPTGEEVAPSVGISYRREEPVSREVVKELEKKDEKQFAEEILTFLSKEFPDTDRFRYHNTDLFWEQKGIHRWSLEPKLRLKIEKVNAIVQQKLEQGRLRKEKEQIKKEKELLPELVEECLEWAKKNQIKKATKSNIDYFLIEKEIELTKTSRDILYSKVNFKLRR